MNLAKHSVKEALLLLGLLSCYCLNVDEVAHAETTEQPTVTQTVNQPSDEAMLSPETDDKAEASTEANTPSTDNTTNDVNASEETDTPPTDSAEEKEDDSANTTPEEPQVYDAIIMKDGQAMYVEPQQWNGVLARNKWSYSPTLTTWLYSDEAGIIRKEAARTLYKEGEQQFTDIVVNVNNLQLYYEPKEWGGVLARNKWSYSPTLASWLYSDENGFIRKEASRESYKEGEQTFSDVLVTINGYKFYYEPQQWNGILARNKWSYSPTLATWVYSDTLGIVRKEASRTSYTEGTQQFYDIVVAIHQYKFYYEPQQWHGILARDKWSYSPTAGLWYKSDAQGIIQEQTLRGTHDKLQQFLNRYVNEPIGVYFESLVQGDARTASLRGDRYYYGASVPKIVLAAYTQDRIERGLLSWDTEFVYTSGVNNRPESYLPGGSGSIQYDNPWGKKYTVKDIVYRTMAHSDNIGSNMLLHYVGYADKQDFDRFTQRVYNQPKYSLNITPKQASQVMKYLASQKEQHAMKSLDKTNYDGTKLDTVPQNVYQKIGAVWPTENHTTGIVMGDKKYTLTILTQYWSDSRIGELAKAIYRIVMNP